MADSGTYDQATITRRQRIAEQMLAESSRPQPIRHWAQGLAQLGNIGADVFALNRLDKQAGEARKADTAALMSILDNGAGGAPAAPSAVASPSPSPAPAMPPPSPTVIGDRTRMAESGGDPLAKNPNSSATGPDQFINSTWLDTIKRNRPDLATGKDDAALLAMRTDPDLSGQMRDAYATQNRHVLSDRGLPVTPGSTYLAHFAGPEGASKVLSADPKMRVAELLSPAAMRANPMLANMSAGDMRSWADRKMGDGAPAPAVAQAMGPSAALPPANAPAPAAPSPAAPGALPTNQPTGIPPQQRQAIAALMMATPGSPAQQLGIQLAAQSLKPHDYTHQTLPDGTILRLDPTGKAPPQVVYQAQTKPSFGVVGKDRYGNDVHGFIDPMKQSVNPVALPSAPPGQGAANPDVTGDAFLSTLPKPQADQIKGITEGRIAPPGAFALKTPYWQKMLTDVAQYEPGFDLTKWGARAATAKDFASGKSAQNITSFNTVLQHLDTLDKAATGLNNYSFTPANTLANYIKSKTGDPAIKNFEVAKTAVADELTRAFRGTGGNVHDLTQWENAINAANSPEQLRAAIRQASELLRGRIDALGDTYNRGMNTKTEPVKLLSQKAQDTIERLSAPARGEAKAAASSGPGRDEIEAELKRRGLAP